MESSVQSRPLQGNQSYWRTIPFRAEVTRRASFINSWIKNLFRTWLTFVWSRTTTHTSLAAVALSVGRVSGVSKPTPLKLWPEFTRPWQSLTVGRCGSKETGSESIALWSSIEALGGLFSQQKTSEKTKRIDRITSKRLLRSTRTEPPLILYDWE